MALLQDCIFKILTPADWQSAQDTGAVTTALDRADGFVHLSKHDQLPGTLERFFKEDPALHLLAYILEDLDDRVTFEPSRDGALFPHLYGSLSPYEAICTWQITRGDDERFMLPTDLLPTSDGEAG